MKNSALIRLINTFLLCMVVMLPANIFADTIITSHITEDTIWDTSGSPYIITGDINIYQNVTLTIDGGVAVKFNQDAGLTIGGQLIAQGTTGDPVTFTSNLSTPAQGDWSGISFVNTAATATYQSDFEYDYNNHQLLLNYLSGSIIEYCVIEYADMGVKGSAVYPCVKSNTFRYCKAAAHFGNSQPDSADPTACDEKWLFFYGNTITQCQTGLEMTTRGNDHAVISANTFSENTRSGILSPGFNIPQAYAWSSGMLLFNNQFINNTDINEGEAVILIDRYGTYQSPPFVLLYNNTITNNVKGFQVLGHLVALHNYIYNNRMDSYIGLYPDGAGCDLGGPAAYLFNNTIQQNGVNASGHGDGIFLQTSHPYWEDTLNEFVINYNNLGNSVWDLFDIYIEPDEDNCAWSQGLEVDATHNYWQTSDPADTIYDSSDDMCAGVVNYEPKLSSAMIPSPLQAHPTLISPANYAEVEQTPPASLEDDLSYTINFSWSPVTGATKYLLCTYGYEYLDNSANNIVEVTNGTSASITSHIEGTEYDHFVHWFVVAGNDSGWGLPSALRHVRVIEPSDNGDPDDPPDAGGGGGGGGGCFIAIAAH